MSPDLRRSQEMYRLRAPAYDRVVRRSEVTRRAAVDALRLQPGDVVVDVGCGTGLSFPHIEERIGESGRIIAIEPSPDMLALARERIGAGGWGNVVLIEAAAEDALLPEPPDAVLFHFVHDVMRSPAALENVLRQAKPGAQVAAAGAKHAPWWALPARLYIMYISRKYTTTSEGFDRPWSYLERFVPGLQVRPALYQAAYVAWGTYRPPEGAA